MNRLDLVMIVRDEARCLERCLASARPWVDGIVVARHRLDRRHGRDRAPPRRARGTFRMDRRLRGRAQRRAGRERRAPGALVLDADEWIVEGGESLAGAARRRRRTSSARSASPACSTPPAAASADAPSWLPRLLPRGVRYAGRIHEQPESALPRRRLPLVVGHDGYLDAHKARQGGPQRARCSRLALDEPPDDAYLHYQLGKDLELRARFAEA